MEFFDRQWRSYRAIVENNLMEHRQVAQATAEAVEDWLATRAAEAPAPAMVDLGCGDLALLAPLLRRLPLGSYTGVDLAAVVLPLAEQALGAVPYPSRWLEGDLLAWARGVLAGDSAGDHPSGDTDLLHSAFAMHHLEDEAKVTFLRAARQRISPQGLFVWVDVFREAGEARAHYIQRYAARVARDWQSLTDEQRQHVIDHLSRFDIPADRAAIARAAEEAGWHWRWAWQGTHRAEALAVLTPA
ncbi:MAG: class I SAM-dependent methyltransferase [Cyanobium sp.]